MFGSKRYFGAFHIDKNTSLHSINTRFVPEKKGITAGIERCVFVTYAIDKSNIKNAYEEAFFKAYYQVILWKLLTLPVLAFFFLVSTADGASGR